MKRAQIEDKLKSHEDLIVQLMDIIRVTNEKICELELSLQKLEEKYISHSLQRIE